MYCTYFEEWLQNENHGESEGANEYDDDDDETKGPRRLR
jgi:hypothetical protein